MKDKTWKYIIKIIWKTIKRKDTSILITMIALWRQIGKYERTRYLKGAKAPIIPNKATIFYISLPPSLFLSLPLPPYFCLSLSLSLSLSPSPSLTGLRERELLQTESGGMLKQKVRVCSKLKQKVWACSNRSSFSQSACVIIILISIVHLSTLSVVIILAAINNNN